MINRRITLFKVLDTPVTAEPSALITPLSLFGLAAGLGGGRSWPARLRLGLLMVLAYALSDLAHYGGHLLSARYACAPVDEIRLAAPMPLTLYHNNNVSPRTHQLRSIGGPAGSALAWLVALLLRPLTPAGTAWRTWLTLVAWLNGLLAASSLLHPLPFIDSGVLLKWELVQRGYSEPEAEKTVREAATLTTTLGLVAGLVLAAGRGWLPTGWPARRR